MKKKIKYLNPLFSFFIFFLIWTPLSFAQSDISYPELDVSPRASQRLNLEAKKEKNGNTSWYSYNLPIQTSALLNLLSAAYLKGNIPKYSDINDSLEKDKKITQANQSAQIGFLVGATWLGFTTYMQTTYSPYQGANKEISKMSSKTKRKQLIKERIAEEKLSEPAQIHRRMAYFSSATNFASSIFMAENSENEAKTFALLSAAVSLLPLFFDSHWEKVYKKQKEYKKKIYGPVAFSYLIQDPDQSLHPALGLKLNF